jgi:hypothetical protein
MWTENLKLPLFPLINDGNDRYEMSPGFPWELSTYIKCPEIRKKRIGACGMIFVFVEKKN